ncbi:MAG: hypothetical protein ACXAC6_02900 [Candidatus Hodarchaeales archaeon]
MKIETILLKISNYFEEMEIPYAIIGGFSAIVWGRGRSTYDIDIIIDHKKLKIADFVEFVVEQDMKTSEYELQEAFKELSHATILTMDPPFYRVDLRGIYSSLDRETIEKAEKVKFKDQNISFASPETLIAHKLHFGSDRDLEDALVVFIAQRDEMDLDYLVLLSNKLGVGKKLERLIEISQEDNELPSKE